MFGQRKRINKPEALEARQRWRSCRIKRRYESDPKIAGSTAYRCRYCGGYHVATKKVK